MATPPAEDLPGTRRPSNEPDRTADLAHPDRIKDDPGRREPAPELESGREPRPAESKEPPEPRPTGSRTAEVPAQGQAMVPEFRPTRISGTWAAVVVAAVVLIFLLIFILQNLITVTVNLLGFSWAMPLGVAMLFAAIAGAILVALVGTARILQLRRYAKRLGTMDRPKSGGRKRP
jgi:uncharacterized integral membrane protein